MDTTIILQGITTPKINLLETISEYVKFANVIVSIYFSKETPDLIEKIQYLFPDVMLVDNDIKEYEKEISHRFPDIKEQYYKNTFFQVMTTRNALKYVKTKYTVKTRVDHFYSNISDMIDISKKTGKIAVSSFCIRGIHEYKYHPSDILFCGETCHIIQVFDLAYSQKKLDEISEVFIWKPYILYRVPLIEKYKDEYYLEEMCNLFEVYPINLHKTYRIKVKNFKVEDKGSHKLSWIKGGVKYIDIITNLPFKNKTTFEYFKNGMY